MMIALKGRISIYNEGSFCLPSLSMLILSLSAILTKDQRFETQIQKRRIKTPFTGVLFKSDFVSMHCALFEAIVRAQVNWKDNDVI